MKLIAPKAKGKCSFLAPPAQSSMSKTDFAERFAAVPVHELGNDTNPFALMQFATEMQARMTRLVRKRN